MNPEEDRPYDPSVQAGEPQGEETGPDAKPALDILSRLAVACKSRLLYHANHPAVKDAITVLHAVASDSLACLPGIALRVERDGFVYQGQRIGWERESLRQLASRARARNVRAISFSAGIGLNEMEALVELLATPPESLEEAGGAEAFLIGRGIHGVSVVESEARRTDEEPASAEGDAAREMETAEELPEELPEPLSDEEWEDLLELVFDPERFALALEQLRDESGEKLGGTAWADAAFCFLKDAATLVDRKLPERKRDLWRAMAETLLFLERDLRNLLLLRKLLPESRNEPICAEILGRLNPEEMAGMLSYFLPLAVELIPKLGAWLENVGYDRSERLETIALLRDRLLDLGEIPVPALSPLDETLRSAGLADAARAMPTPQEVSLLSETYQPRELEEIQRVSEMDLALETYVGVTPMLLNLLEQGGRIDNLGKAVELLQENYWGLVAASQFGPAADVLEKIEQVLNGSDPAFAPYRAELERLMEDTSSNEMLGRLVQIASAGRHDPETVSGFTRFMDRLGEPGVLAMIDALGSEESMSVRKFIIDVLAVVARDRLPLLASSLDDTRWYLVRNIVTVMARIRSPFTLGYLDNAMQYPHPKVKAEAVRAIGLTGGHEAGDLLIKGLRDGDENARILCIRWLGRLQVTRAVTRLVAMLEEKEPGGEGLKVKKEIIESLGRIGDPETYDILAKYAGRQKFFFKTEWQELNRVAQEAMKRLQEKYPHLAKKRVAR